MLFNQLFLAAGASALLLVPDVFEDDRDDAVSALPIPIVVDTVAPGMPGSASSQSVSLPCQACKGSDAIIQLDFTVEHGYKLMLNGFELYPSPDPWHNDLLAFVEADGRSKEQTLGYGLFSRLESVDEQNAMSLVAVNLRVLEVGGEMISGMPEVTVKLIKTYWADIMIGSVEVEEAPSHDDFDSAVARIGQKVKDLWAKLRSGCGRHGRKGRHGAGGVNAHEGKRPDGGSRPYRHDYPHRHRFAQKGHEWAKLVKNIAVNIVLPVLAGITAGVSVAVMAMGVCSLFALVFHARRRSRRRAAARSKAAASEPAFAEEKVGLMESEDAPPQYQDEEQQAK